MSSDASRMREMGSCGAARPAGRGEGCVASVGRALAVSGAFLVAALSSTVADGGGAAGSRGGQGQAFEVSEFQLAYAGFDNPKLRIYHHPGLPPIAEMMQLEVTVGQVADGYVAPHGKVAPVTFRLIGVPDLKLRRFYASAIQSIQAQIVASLRRRGLTGIFVAPHPEDKRPGGRKPLRLIISLGVVTQVRTVASGTRVPTSERVNSPRHEHIRRRSPVKPFSGDAAERSDLLRQDQLERYIYQLSRHPGRRVDVALSPGGAPGEAVVDYLVHENKPWYAYLQYSNTGTKHTGKWRERFGFVHNQLTGRDDILALDYITADFDEAHAVVVSYEAPLLGWDRLRWRVFGSWHEYTASDIGLADAEFRGEGWHAGAEVITNIFQHREFFLDAVLGARYEHLYVKDVGMGSSGKDDLFVPHLGLRFERVAPTTSTWGSMTLEWNHASIAHTNSEELTRLGRLGPDMHWSILKFGALHSWYLEPLLNGKAWEDPSTYRSSTLAHEVVLSLRGQYALGSRLIPQNEQVIGGLYSVRGYPESLVAGDSVYVGTVEYRFHVPRVLEPKPKAGRLPIFREPFRYAPQQVYGRPDWDLILRAFYDLGRTVHTHRQSLYEKDQVLKGAGVGVELQIKSNVTLRCVYAVALSDVDAQGRSVSSGNNEVYAVLTFSF